MKYLLCIMTITVMIAGGSRAVAADAAQAKRLLQTFRTSKDVEKRDAAFDELLKLDAKTIEGLNRTINAALIRERAAYLRLFAKQAARMGATRAKSIPAAEVKSLRDGVLALGQAGDPLTKEILKEKAVPALAKIREHLMISPSEVLENDAKLRTQRERLLTLASQKYRCETTLAALDPQAEPIEKIDIEKQLAEEEDAATIQSMPISPVSKATFAANAKRAARLDPQAVAATRQCNLTRALLGLSVLTIDPRLIKAGEMHSADMEKHKFFDHMSPVAGRNTPFDRARLAGTTASAENIFVGKASMSGVLVSDAWFVSPGHHRNMLRPEHIRIGVGRHGKYFTQMFGR